VESAQGQAWRWTVEGWQHAKVIDAEVIDAEVVDAEVVDAEEVAQRLAAKRRGGWWWPARKAWTVPQLGRGWPAARKALGWMGRRAAPPLIVQSVVVHRSKGLVPALHCGKT
jgi:hypothetical protein